MGDTPGPRKARWRGGEANNPGWESQHKGPRCDRYSSATKMHPWENQRTDRAGISKSCTMGTFDDRHHRPCHSESAWSLSQTPIMEISHSKMPSAVPQRLQDMPRSCGSIKASSEAEVATSSWGPVHRFGRTTEDCQRSGKRQSQICVGSRLYLAHWSFRRRRGSRGTRRK